MLDDLDGTTSQMRSVLERYATDHAALRRFYSIPMSTSRMDRTKKFYVEWLESLAQIDFDEVNQDGRIDYLLFKNQLDHELRKLEHQAKRNAAILPLVPFWETIVELEEARRQMKPIDPSKVAGQLVQLSRQVEQVRKAVGDKAIKVKKTVANRAAGRVNDLRSTLRNWYRFYNGYDPQFTWWASDPYQKVDRALESYASFIRGHLVGVKQDDDDTIIGDPIGRDALLSELAYEMIPYTPEELIAIAEQEFAWCDAEMLRASRDLGYGDDWGKALEHVKTLHVDPGKQPELIRDQAREAVRFLDKHGLVTIPELCRETWRMEMMSPQRQKVNPFFTGGETIRVSFPTNTMSHEQKLMSLRGNNIHFSRATVHHELIPGHHLQGFMSARHRTHRRPFRTPFWGEGWALYWELLLWDLDFPQSPENRIGMLFWRMHRCARIIFSLSFHLEKMTAQESIDFLVDRVGHELDNATGEVRRSVAGSYGPLYQCAYLLGGLQIRALHKELVESGQMTNREFHDAVLKENSIPIEMIRASLTNQELTREFPSKWKFYGENPAAPWSTAAPAGTSNSGSAAAPVAGKAQGIWKDYQRAERFSSSNLSKLVFKTRVVAHWIGKSRRFWYRNDVRGDREFVLVDAEQGTRGPAFDQEKLAAALSDAAGGEYQPNRLPFDSIQFINDGKAIQFGLEGAQWTCDLTTYQCTKGERTETDRAEDQPPGGRQRGASPDRRWVAFVRDYNLYVRSVETGEEIQLSYDGEKHYDYATPLPSPRAMIQQGTMEISPSVSVNWSPDSKKLVTYRLDQRNAGRFTLVQSVPPRGIRPVHYTYAYPLAGEVGLARAEPVIFDVENIKQIPVETEAIHVLYYGGPRFHWFKDSQRVHFTYRERGYQKVQLLEIDANTGKARVLVEERSDTNLDPHMLYTRILDDGAEIIWSSERDGWCHLYLYDGKTGELKNRITEGPWVVRGITHVDEEARQIYFTAGGREEGRDPYFSHLYRVSMDGSGLTLLTPGNGEHSARFSPSREYFIDTYSRVDLAPVSELRRTSDGALVCELERADIDSLLETGWKWPEPFQVKARDGVTDIYGVIWRPSTFDPSKKYPVVEQIYTGPHGFFVPKTFSRAYRHSLASIAELGFIGVMIDGMGTAKRSKAFHDVSYKNLGDGGLDDHIAGLKQMAARYPCMDLTRVGVYGGSAGGYDSTHALLTHPEFYKVAVSTSGNHDHRMDKAWWVELWMGYPVGDHYREQSNLTLAHKLQGKLLLAHGELDDNVHPSSTLQLVDALIKANKDFDLVLMPGRAHGLGGPYMTRRRWDYFVKHLLRVEPPKGYKIGESDRH